MKISFVRGAYLNNFEGQNYGKSLTGYSSLFPLDDNVSFPLVKLPSIADLQKIPLLNKPLKYITNRIWGDSQILFGLEKHIQGSDIVHVADPHYYYSYQAARLRAQGKIKKLVSTWWETIPFNNESTAAKKRIKKYTMNQVDMFICHTKLAQKCLIKEGVSADKISFISLGVDLTVFKPKLMEKSYDFRILFVGRLVEEKGILDLYKAFKEIAKTEQEVVLKIVGAGPFEKKLRSLVQEDGLDKKITIEQKSYQEMPQVFQCADVFCAPSKKTKVWEEQLGMVFLEAMASGLPIVSYKTGSITEVIGNAGLLAEEGNISELTTLIIQIIRAKDLGRKNGTIGRERAERLYDCKKTRDKIYKIYQILSSK